MEDQELDEHMRIIAELRAEAHKPGMAQLERCIERRWQFAYWREDRISLNRNISIRRLAPIIRESMRLTTTFEIVPTTRKDAFL